MTDCNYSFQPNYVKEIARLVADQIVEKEIYDDRERKIFLVREEHDDRVTFREVQINKPEIEPRARHHHFTTLDGFIDYLNSKHTNMDTGIIFVQESNLVCDLQYFQKNQNEHIITMDLEISEEFKSLCVLFRGVTQKTLWTLLSTALYGKVSPNLFISLDEIKIKKEDMTDVKIDTFGLQSTKKESKIILTVPQRDNAPVERKIERFYKYTGKYYQCFDKTIEVEMMLECSVNNDKLEFVFHPKNLKEIIIQHKLDLIQYIRESLPAGDQFTIHEGFYKK